MIYVILWNCIKYLTKITCHHVFFQLSSLIWLWVLDFLSSLSCCRDVASTGWNTCAAALEAYQQHRAIPSVWPLQSCLQVRTVLRHPAYRGNAPICNEHIQATQIPIQMQIGTITFVTKMSHNSWHLCKLGSVINVRVCVCASMMSSQCMHIIYIYILHIHYSSRCMRRHSVNLLQIRKATQDQLELPATDICGAVSLRMRQTSELHLPLLSMPYSGRRCGICKEHSTTD